MGCTLRISGRMRVRDMLGSRALLEKLNGYMNRGLNLAVEDHPEEQTFTVHVNSRFYCSYVDARHTEEVLKEFGPYVTEVARFDVLRDLDHDEILVGEEEVVHKVQRAALLQEAQQAIDLLTDEEQDQLVLKGDCNQ